MASAPWGDLGGRGSKTMLLNVGGAALVLLGAVLALKYEFQQEPETPPCDARFSGGVLFSYSRQGHGPLSPEDLQARLAGTDRGLIKNSAIVADADAPNGYALEVALKRSSGEEDDQSRSGIGFTWVPRQLPLATAACLSYNVWIPADFQMGEGGVLPGLVSDQPAGEPTAAHEGAQADPNQIRPFLVRPHWRQDGALLMQQQPNIGAHGTVLLDPQKGGLQRGKWARIEQEVELNSPNREDGKLRVWVNGKLMLERFDIGYRRDENQSLQAITGDIHHTRFGGWAPAPDESKLRISPLELRLR